MQLALQRYMPPDRAAATAKEAGKGTRGELCLRLMAPPGAGLQQLIQHMNPQEVLTAALYGWRPIGIEVRIRQRSEFVDLVQFTLFDRTSATADAEATDCRPDAAPGP